MTTRIHIYRLSDPKPLSALWARTFWQRMRGLIGRPSLNAGEGLLISPCSSVHTFGMKYSLDLVFLNMKGRVIKLVADLRPYKFAGCLGASHVLEMSAGSIEAYQIEPGQVFNWIGG